MNETYKLWRQGLVGILLLVLVGSAFAAPPDNRPPENRPPDKGEPPNVPQPIDVNVDTSVPVDIGITSGDVGVKTGDVQQLVEGSPVTIDTSDSPIAINSGGNKHESNFFALSTTFPNGHGCFGGAQGGAAGDGGGGWFGVHWLNWACFSNYVSDTKKSIKVKARLDCSARGFRNAIAFDVKKNRQKSCVNFMETEYKAQIEFDKQQVLEGIANGTIRTYAMNSGDSPLPK